MTRARVPGRSGLHARSTMAEDGPPLRTTAESHTPDSVPCLQVLTEILTLGCVAKGFFFLILNISLESLIETLPGVLKLLPTTIGSLCVCFGLQVKFLIN